MSSTAIGVVMSCPSRCARLRVGGSSAPGQARATARGRRTAVDRARVPLELEAKTHRRARAAGTRRVVAGGQAPARAAPLGASGLDRPGRPGRLLLAAERLQSDHDVEWRANAAYEHYRATARDRCVGGRAAARAVSAAGAAGRQGEHHRPGLATDPDRVGFVQRYNDQAAVNEQQIVLPRRPPTSRRTSRSLTRWSPRPCTSLSGPRSISRPGVAADAGYWNEQRMDEVVATMHVPVLPAPDERTSAAPKRRLTVGAPHGCAACLSQSTAMSAIANASSPSADRSATLKHNDERLRFHRRQDQSPPSSGDC